MKIVATTLLLPMLAILAFAQSSTPTARKPQAAALWKQEPNGFRGHTFDSSRSDLGFSPEQPLGQQCFSAERYRGARSEKCELTEGIGNVGVSFRYYFRDDKLVEISGDFNSENYEALRDIFIGAYGNPHQSQHPVERTAIGATFQNELLGWNGKRVSIFMTKYLSDIKDGGFSITLKSEEAELDRVKREANREAVESIK